MLNRVNLPVNTMKTFMTVSNVWKTEGAHKKINLLSNAMSAILDKGRK